MSEPIKFPTRRLKDAGATAAEIQELHMQFARSDAVYQKQFVSQFVDKSKIEVQVWIEDARLDGTIPTTATNTPDPEADKPKRDRTKTNASVHTGNEDDDDNES